MAVKQQDNSNNSSSSSSANNGNGNNNNGNGASVSSESNVHKLQMLLRLMRTTPDSREKFCETIVRFLAQEPLPKDKEGIKQFNETLLAYKSNLAELCSDMKRSTGNDEGQQIINECLKCLYKLMVSAGAGSRPPSVAASIVLSLFNATLIPAAVKWMIHGGGYNVGLMNEEDDLIDGQQVAIQRVFDVLAGWISTITCTPNINVWMVEIVTALSEEKRFDLLNTLALSHTPRLLITVKIPVFRNQVLPVLNRLLLYGSYQSPQLIHTSMPRLLEVAKIFTAPQQVLSDKEVLFLRITRSLIIRFAMGDSRYKDVESTLELCVKKVRENQEKAQQHQLDNQDQVLLQSSHIQLTTLTNENNNPRVGLVNLGNTCYMNSVLQALVMTKHFSREFLMLKPISSVDCRSKMELVFIIQKLLAQLLHSRRPELTPREVLQATRPPGFLPGHQQDSSEFLGHLMDTLHEQEVQLRKRRRVTQSDGTTLMEEEGLEDNLMEWMDDDDGQVASGGVMRTLIQRSFGGSITITYQCLSCGERSTNRDTFRDISLSFPDHDHGEGGSSMPTPRSMAPYYVQNLLDYYCASEKLHGENKYFCDKCETLVDGLRSIAFMEAPRNLILTLKHFKYDQLSHSRAKLMHNVFHNETVTLKVVTPGNSTSNPNCTITSGPITNTPAQSPTPKLSTPLTLSASSLLVSQTSNTLTASSGSASLTATDGVKIVKYMLYAVVVHSGMSMDAGHYWTLASDHPNSWFQFNDNYVSKSSIEDLHKLRAPQTPYILFYRRVGKEDQESVSLPELEELPAHLRDFIVKDNFKYEETKRRERASNAGAGVGGSGPLGHKRMYRDDSDDDPPTPNCGGNAIDHFNSYIC